MSLGYGEGDVCNRNGCVGRIESHPVENCSCHISPPCNACVERLCFCPECGWDEENDPAPTTPAPVIARPDPYADAWWRKPMPTVADLDPTKIGWINRSHSSSSMIKEGVYPEGTTMKELLDAINGTFGGRFESHTPPENGKPGRFKFIAYTD